MMQSKTYNILLIEPDASLRRIISLGLQNQGYHVIEANAPTTVPVLDAQQLHLLILDLDNNMESDWRLLEAAQSHPRFAQLPTIVLSWEYPFTQPHNSTVATTALSQIIYQIKPFDARTLQANVAQLLTAYAAQEAALTAHTEEALIAAYTAKTPPSIWPLVTAAGMVLAFVGFMLQFTISILGILIVIIGLLWWTLGNKPLLVS